MKTLKTLLIPAFASLSFLCSAASPSGNVPAVVVQEALLLSQSEPKSYVGTIKASETVAITAKVSGTLWKSAFREGSVVKKGDLLFELEDTVFKANLAAAQAQLARLEAELRYAEKEHDRYRRLLNSQAASQTAYESALRTYESCKAQVGEAKAKVLLCENELSYTKIYAPLGGRIGENIFSEGNQIAPASGELATIVRFDPISIRFSMNEAEFFKRFQKGQLVGNTLQIVRADGTVFTGKAKVDFYDNQVDSKTGTLMIQLECENPDMVLMPGGYVTVNFTELFDRPQIAVRVSALMFDGDGYSVYVVDANNKAVRRPVKVGQQIRDMQIIASGLNAGERVVTGGLHKVRPGETVIPATGVTANKEE